MMKKIWDFCKDKNLGRESKIRLFLFLNIICWCVIGAALWLIVSRVALDNMTWLFVFIGYAGVFLASQDIQRVVRKICSLYATLHR